MARFLAGSLLIVVFFLTLTACSLASETGIASWYSTESCRTRACRTANGERFTGREMTAAHRALRFGTRVRVENLKNGRSVVVRINDRGPAKWTHRMIDVSHAAAWRLGMLASGTARVRITVLH